MIMHKIIFILIATSHGTEFEKTAEDKTKIFSTLQSQTKAWNDGDIDSFMQCYWKSDELTFSAGGTTTRGWQKTLERYKKKYPIEKMGKLSFSDFEFTSLGNKAALVLGRWKLKIADTEPEGNFSLVFKKINNHWKIIHDHSSSLAKDWNSSSE